MTTPITLTLHRFDQTDAASYGFITDNCSKQFAVTLEPPAGVDAHSCIPAGSYTVVRVPKGAGVSDYDVFHLIDVPDRGVITLRFGSTVDEADHAILLGEKFGTWKGPHGPQRGLLGPMVGFEQFMHALRGVDAFTLVIIDPLPPSVAHAA